MKRSDIIKSLTRSGTHVPSDQPRTGWVLAPCPLAPWRHSSGTNKKPSFAVKEEKGDPFTNCFSCGWHGTLSDLVVELHHKRGPDGTPWGSILEEIETASDDGFDLSGPDIEELLFGETEDLHEYPGWWLETFISAEHFAWSREYLRERNVSSQMSVQLDLRADTDQKRICFPVRDFTGRLIGLHGRCVLPDVEPRYRMYTHAGKNNPIAWLGEDKVDRSSPIVVVEGPFDYTSVLRVYPNTVCPLFANPSLQKIRRMSDALEWVTFLDAGSAGDKGRARIDQALHTDHIVNHVVPPEGRKDPGEMTEDELRESLTGYVQLIAKTD